ncbi:TatD family hydrolase [Companilactobacillus versmoldensis]|uniref:TatD family deoxyribonuclease n=1 Tax=Companilactobacillus versmoldensis DSM 14857 = KCTC 3814 TaxID=1423815 RepID=A0A0R1S9C1_9LACO|nr:TatD family hydrolase [Companilactobacillus versmoldensis]KRL65616.1 TatD family deoxyribonuclease [Companilactobacillus versmoldensis DSM 14857 = KCTC 3814]
MKIFDSHTHLNDEAFKGQTKEYIARAQELDVDEMAIIGSNEEFNIEAIRLAQNYQPLHAVVGWHPEFAKEYNEEQLVNQIKLPEVVAIGEIGLDYHWDGNPSKKEQQATLIQQLDVAKQYNMPVSIHCRDAFDDMYPILKDHDLSKSGIIMHSFNGDVDWLNKFLDLGLWVSYSGVVSFKNAPEVHESAKATPLDRMLVETDAPYLTPEPYRGHKNEPGYTRYVVDAIAKLKDVTPDEVAEHTFNNAKKVYNLK